MNNNNNITTREVNEKDYALLRELAKKCPPLDLHTPYTYWVIAKYFGKCSFIIYNGNTPIGYIMCIVSGNTLLIWQIGILEEYRKQKMSSLLIDRVFKWYEMNLVNQFDINVSISRDNIDSFSAFNQYCFHNGYEMSPCSEVRLTDADNLDCIECETLYQITKKHSFISK